jgi:hypothetical protein
VKFEGVPESYDEILMSARGEMFLGNVGGAKELLMKCASLRMSFKEALEVFNIGMFEMKDEEFSREIEEVIHKQFPSYELRFRGVYEIPALLGKEVVEDD